MSTHSTVPYHLFLQPFFSWYSQAYQSPSNIQQVAQIIPIGISTSYNTKIQELNKAIIPWAQGLNTTASPIWVVDQYTGFSGTADLRDGVHPNDAGDVKMANVWYPALVTALQAAKADKVAVMEAEAKREVTFEA
jgi:lysophospholipase L1-like esterase